MSHQTLDLSAAVGRNAVAYVSKVCAQAHIGLTETRAGEDVLAIDATIDYHEQGIRVQIKGTTGRSLVAHGGQFTVPIEDAWREKWQRNRSAAYFILVLMSRDVDSWFALGATETLAASYALWARVDDLPDTATHVVFDRSVRFSSETLAGWHQQLMTAGYGDPGGDS
ncbi:DUF4365 domain-containing protein [Nocardioides dubius]|uniref:DUF4365 domain-containing protein n=1 Tax=Nocardioides dubius TaxID=317019 RepID=A0ABN1U3D8_9ACTN